MIFGSRVGFLAELWFLRQGPSCTHCCRALTFASGRLSCKLGCKMQLFSFSQSVYILNWICIFGMLLVNPMSVTLENNFVYRYSVYIIAIYNFNWRQQTLLLRLLVFDFIFTAQCTLVQMRGLGIACRPSVCLSVTLVDCDHICWKSWKLIPRQLA